MSRFRTLKEEKIKNRMKSISFMLALSLLIGLVQGLGTYALFTDTEDIASNLAVSTGDVDVEVYTDEDSELGFQDDMIENGSSKSKNFKILNKGTLNQTLKLKLTTNSDLPTEVLRKVTYELELKDGTQLIANINVDFEEIKQNREEVINYTLNPGREIDCTVTISVGELDNQIEGMKNIEFDLDILATQIGYENNNGFTDLYKQHNSFIIGQYTQNGLISTFTLDTKSINILVPFQRFKSVTVYSGEGQFKDGITTTLNGNKNGFKISKNKAFNVLGLLGGYSEEKTLTVQVQYTNNKTEWWRIYFNYTPFNLQAYYNVIAPPTKEVVEPSTEENEAPSEVEVVEPSTEENEAPSEVEVVEPSTEDIEVPSEELVEPSIEEIKVPDEEVVLPLKEETEIEE